MFCHLSLWLVLGLALLSPVTWLPIPQHSRDCSCSAPHIQGLKATPDVGHTHISAEMYAQHFQDYIMSHHKHDYSWCPGLARVNFQERKDKKVLMVLKVLVCFAHYACSVFALTICFLQFVSCRLHHLFHSCVFILFRTSLSLFSAFLMLQIQVLCY